MSKNKLQYRRCIKCYLRTLVAECYYYSGLYKTYHKGMIHILMYHRVLKDNDKALESIQPGMYVTESVFKEQMSFITKYYHIISLSELLKLWSYGKYDKNERYCIVTFDDGWLDNYLYAYPILKNFDIPATIFLATSYIDTNRWFWPEKLSYLLIKQYQNILKLCQAKDDIADDVISTIFETIINNKKYDINDLIDIVIESLKPYSQKSVNHALCRIYKLLDLCIPDERMLLNWNEIKEMSQNGISFGSHTCNHTILTGVPLSEAIEEIERSKNILIEKEINFVPVFCYPNGNYNKEVKSAVRDSGYEAAVTTKFGYEDEKPDNYYEIKRIGIHNDISTTMAMFSFHLSGLRYGL